jgi:hypothetical protein
MRGGSMMRITIAISVFCFLLYVFTQTFVKAMQLGSILLMLLAASIACFAILAFLYELDTFLRGYRKGR